MSEAQQKKSEPRQTYGQHFVETLEKWLDAHLGRSQCKADYRDELIFAVDEMFKDAVTWND